MLQKLLKLNILGSYDINNITYNNLLKSGIINFNKKQTYFYNPCTLNQKYKTAKI